MRDDCRAFFLVLAAAAALAGCARTQSPVLYPNAHLQQVGQEQANRDIEACRELASQNVPSAAGKEIAKDAAVGAAGGAAVGAVAGAVTGHGAGNGRRRRRKARLRTVPVARSVACAVSLRLHPCRWHVHTRASTKSQR